MSDVTETSAPVVQQSAVSAVQQSAGPAVQQSDGLAEAVAEMVRFSA